MLNWSGYHCVVGKNRQALAWCALSQGYRNCPVYFVLFLINIQHAAAGLKKNKKYIALYFICTLCQVCTFGYKQKPDWLVTSRLRQTVYISSQATCWCWCGIQFTERCAQIISTQIQGKKLLLWSEVKGQSYWAFTVFMRLKHNLLRSEDSSEEVIWASVEKITWGTILLEKRIFSPHWKLEVDSDVSTRVRSSFHDWWARTEKSQQ